MEKVIRNGMVAVLYSPGYGAGWYSWNSNKKLIFHPKLVDMVELGKQSKITEKWLKEEGLISEDEYVYCGGVEDLKIEWLPEGTAFTIDEYDGAESIQTVESLTIIA